MQQLCGYSLPVNFSENNPSIRILHRNSEEDQKEAIIYACAILSLYLMSAVGFLIEFVVKREDSHDMDMYSPPAHIVAKLRQGEKKDVWFQLEARRDVKKRMIKQLQSLHPFPGIMKTQSDADITDEDWGEKNFELNIGKVEQIEQWKRLTC